MTVKHQNWTNKIDLQSYLNIESLFFYFQLLFHSFPFLFYFIFYLQLCFIFQINLQNQNLQSPYLIPSICLLWILLSYLQHLYTEVEFPSLHPPFLLEDNVVATSSCHFEQPLHVEKKEPNAELYILRKNFLISSLSIEEQKVPAWHIVTAEQYFLKILLWQYGYGLLQWIQEALLHNWFSA